MYTPRFSPSCSGSPAAPPSPSPRGAGCTGHITQTSTTQVTLAPNVFHHVPCQRRAGAGRLFAGHSRLWGSGLPAIRVYGRVIDNNVTVSGSNSFIAVVAEETVLTLNVNSDTTLRDGAMTMVILGLKTSEDD